MYPKPFRVCYLGPKILLFGYLDPLGVIRLSMIRVCSCLEGRLVFCVLRVTGFRCFRSSGFFSQAIFLAGVGVLGRRELGGGVKHQLRAQGFRVI